MKLCALLILTVALVQLAAAHPVVKEVNSKRAEETSYDPEAAAKITNGPLPSELEQKYGMALNATEYPSSVAEALSPKSSTKLRTASSSTSADVAVRQATNTEIDIHTFYTKLSAAAYCRSVIPGGDFTCKHCDPSLQLIKTFTTLIDDTNVMVLRGDAQKAIYVAFRGTSSIRSFVVDVVFLPVDYPVAKGTKVHKGFLESYNSVRDDLIKTVLEQAGQYPDYEIAITGHSLGGAQAVLCALDLLNTNGTQFSPVNLKLYTQGQPRVGDSAFANYLLNTKISYERLVNKRDLIPHLPPGFMNFLHSGSEFWINNDGVQVCPDGIETDSCSNSIVPFTSVLDHLTYLDINVGLCL
ncbi:lipase [Zychaea mexicana]|uniref:lipase n=1 Tax=Zychaea mexicana TaxID=64656 RepID=UPI0022FEEB05|nr:lipase [Zychaea mexicana]KAI9489134.1 lipase [Zychaea mexicana]